MACVVKSKGASWEVRQSVHTPAGPRSRTLATFQELTPEVAALAAKRSATPLTSAQLQTAARRAGAPVAQPPAEQAARRLLTELAAGRKPRGVLARLLADRLGNSGQALSDAQLAASQWLGATAEDRGAALVDLLLLTDALPAPTRPRRSAFPRFEPAEA